MGWLSFFGKKDAAPRRQTRALADLSAGDTIVLSPTSPLPGRWVIDKAHRFVDIEQQTLVFWQFEVTDGERRHFVEVHRPNPQATAGRAVVSFPLDPTEYGEVEALELDPESPPDQLTWRQRDYQLVAARNLRFYRNTGEHPRDMLHMEYATEAGRRTLTFEFWSSTGTPVTSEGLCLTPDEIE
ncbi:hypothetical protein [Chloracidobacterium thermophilum]|uniref:hypothetical protein n=1 Tax=Chloracidobacterium thermophilum TaxID=458033 RepID=UPI000738C3E4|nr:hypothetical protein [Chloracidobacterium thermophilum]